ncbi:MAG: tetratricopeptide repeat protein [Deltaproteobacteria bacterium]|nr:tetratricopeptide repeat protein [Deltaproteobacteria bacterium]
MADSGEDHASLNREAAQLVAQAEGLRASGQLAEARDLLMGVLSTHPDHALGRLVLALVHLDLGEQDQSRSVLEAALQGLSPAIESTPEPMAAVEDPLEAVQAEMISQVEEPVEALSSPEVATPFAADSPFVNPTMAGLLEQQGHAKEAEALRNAMGDHEVEAAVAEEKPAEDVLAGEMGTDSDTLAIVETLERWLGNVQRGAV